MPFRMAPASYTPAGRAPDSAHFSPPGWMFQWAQPAESAPASSRALSRVSQVWGSIQSSASIKRIKSPLASSMPRLRAEETPPFGL